MNHDAALGRTAGRFLKARAMYLADPVAAGSFVERSGWLDGHVIKAAVGASTTASGSADAFLAQVGRDFMTLVRALSCVGRMRGFRVMEPGTRIARQTSGPSASWFDEGAPIPVVRATFAKDAGLRLRQCGAITVQTEALVRSTSAEAIILRDLALAQAEAIDWAFVDPTNSGTGGRPVAATYGQQAIAANSSPTVDLAEAIEALADGGGDPAAAYWLMRPELYALLLMSRIASEDGRLGGLPVLTTRAIEKDSSGSPIALIDPTGIEFVGGVDAELSVTTQGDIAMSDDPENEPILVSMFQANAAAFRAVSSINWRAASGRAVVIDGANY